MPICIECRYSVPQLYHTSTSAKASKKSSGASSNTSTSASHAAGPAGTSGTHSSNGVPPAAVPIQAESSQRRKAHDADADAQASARRTPAGADVRLTQCPRCKRFADKYVEHDFVVLFIDLVLVKPQVYRHLLFNRLGSDEDAFDPSIMRLGTLLLLFDVYLTWSSVEAIPSELTSTAMIPGLPILAQYCFYLVLCATATLAQHLTVRILARYLRNTFVLAAPQMPSAAARRTPFASPNNSTATPAFGANGATTGGTRGGTHHHTSPSGPQTSNPPGHTPNVSQGHTPNHRSHASVGAGPSPPPPPPPPGPNAISTALFVSSCMQLFPILMVVWEYKDEGMQLAQGVSWAVGAQNVEAVRILLGSTYWSAAGLVAAGALARWIAKRVILNAVGLGGAV